MLEKRISLIPFLLFLCTIPLGEVRLIPGFSWLSPTKIGFLGLLIFLLIKYIRGWRPPIYPHLVVLLSIFLAGVFVSTLFSSQKGESFLCFSRFLALSLLCLITAWVMAEAEAWKKIATGLLIIAMVLSLLGIYQTLTGETIGQMGYYDAFGRMITLESQLNGKTHIITRASGTFDHPNLFGTFLIAMLPFGFISISRRSLRSPATIFILIGTGLCLIALVYTFSRSAWLGLMAGIAIIAFYRRGGLKAICITVLASVIAVGLLPSGGQTILFERGEKTQPYDNVRLYSYRASGRMIYAYPLTGVGLGTFDANYKIYQGPAEIIKQSPLHKMDAHNLFLDLGAEGGLLTLIPFLIILVFTIFYLNHACKSREEDLAAPAALAGLISIIVQGLFNSLGYQEITWIMLGAGWSIGTAFNSSQRSVTEYSS